MGLELFVILVGGHQSVLAFSLYASVLRPGLYAKADSTRISLLILQRRDYILYDCIQRDCRIAQLVGASTTVTLFSSLLMPPLIIWSSKLSVASHVIHLSHRPAKRYLPLSKAVTTPARVKNKYFGY